jgi:Leucine-rich repeat (LRR) protein
LPSYPAGFTGLLDLEVLLLSHRQKHAITYHGRDRDINRNWLGYLPPSFGSLRALEHLEASRIGLRGLPDTLAQLTRLRHLDLSNNTLGWLPDSLVDLKCLEYLDLSQNNFCILPLGI